MTVPHHALMDEFPEYRDRIDQLFTENGHFARLREHYDRLTTQIEALEDDGMPISDEELEKLKFKRLQLKDELYELLRGI
jgi:uncharacterized protein